MRHTLIFSALLGTGLLAASSASFAASKSLVFCSEGSPAGFDTAQYTTATDNDAAAAGLVAGGHGRLAIDEDVLRAAGDDVTAVGRIAVARGRQSADRDVAAAAGDHPRRVALQILRV